MRLVEFMIPRIVDFTQQSVWKVQLLELVGAEMLKFYELGDFIKISNSTSKEFSESS